MPPVGLPLLPELLRARAASGEPARLAALELDLAGAQAARAVDLLQRHDGLNLTLAAAQLGRHHATAVDLLGDLGLDGSSLWDPRQLTLGRATEAPAELARDFGRYKGDIAARTTFLSEAPLDAPLDETVRSMASTLATEALLQLKIAAISREESPLVAEEAMGAAQRLLEATVVVGEGQPWALDRTVPAQVAALSFAETTPTQAAEIIGDVCAQVGSLRARASSGSGAAANLTVRPRGEMTLLEALERSVPRAPPKPEPPTMGQGWGAKRAYNDAEAVYRRDLQRHQVGALTETLLKLARIEDPREREGHLARLIWAHSLARPAAEQALKHAGLDPTTRTLSRLLVDLPSLTAKREALEQLLRAPPPSDPWSQAGQATVALGVAAAYDRQALDVLPAFFQHLGDSAARAQLLNRWLPVSHNEAGRLGGDAVYRSARDYLRLYDPFGKPEAFSRRPLAQAFHRFHGYVDAANAEVRVVNAGLRP